VALAAAPAPETHALRLRLLDIVVRYPGLHLREVARQAEIPASHAQYHLRVLERNGLIAAERQGENLRYYPTKATPVGDVPALGTADRELLQLLRRPAAFRVLLHLLSDGPLALSELARRCRVTPSTMAYHLERLRARDLVGREGEDGLLWRIREPDRIRALLLAHDPPPSLIEGYLDVWQRLGP
jgi:predicted transcriptional regulator